jgi:predicted nuclease with TOPRIM domain
VTAEDERRVIRDAMDRLLAGAPIRSDGKLTVKSLAEEAGVKRWFLTHKYPDLQVEFRDRIAAQNAVPAAQQALLDRIRDLEARLRDSQERLGQAELELRRFTRIVQVLTLENEQLRSGPAHGEPTVRSIGGAKQGSKRQR